ncbi:unknown [Prevotella sp. CAG:1031]|nr:unknown [Prevotella sp. CAG:1031]
MQAIKNPARPGRILTFFSNFDLVVYKGCDIILNR